MDKPSDHWQGLADLSPGSERYHRVKLLLATADFTYLKTRALASRRKYCPDLLPNVECEINTSHFTTGFNNIVLEVAFSDNAFWIARIPHQPVNDGNITDMLSEIATMRTIKNKTTIPVPQVFDFEASSNQLFGYPYAFMEYLGGRSLPDLLVRAIPQQHHAKVATQLANVFAELQNLTFSRIGRLWCGENADQPPETISMSWHASPGPLDTSLEYFYNQQQGANREIMAMHQDANPDWVTACWVLKSALPFIVVEDRVRGPFPLCHLDLHHGNMLFDDEYNLTGVIDWNNAQAAPLEQLSVCPELVTFPGLSDLENQPIVDFKKHILECLREMEMKQEKRAPLDKPDMDMAQVAKLTPLSVYMDSKRAQIIHRQYMASPRGSLWAGQKVAKLMFGESVSWEQLRAVYGNMALE